MFQRHSASASASGRGANARGNEPSLRGPPEACDGSCSSAAADGCTLRRRLYDSQGYRDVGQLSAQDAARNVGVQLMQRFDDLREKMRAGEVKDAAQQQVGAAAPFAGVDAPCRADPF
jgi:hypothetical protein